MNDYFIHGDVRNQIQLKNIGDLRIPLYATTHSQSLFAIEPSIRGIYQVTFAVYHHSVLLRINYDSCICL